MVLVTHELRTPLTGITSFLELLKEEIKNVDQKKYLEHIDKNTKRLQKLIEDILFITRLKTDSPKQEYSSLDVEASVKQTWKSVADKNKKLNFTVKTEESTIVTSEVFWGEILKRVFANCSQYAPAESDVVFLLTSDSKKYSISITNTLSQPLLVEPQSLISAFTKNEKIMNHTQGTGLGLAIVNSLVQSMGGELEISARDKKFSLKFSIAR